MSTTTVITLWSQYCSSAHLYFYNSALRSQLGIACSYAFSFRLLTPKLVHLFHVALLRNKFFFCFGSEEKITLDCDCFYLRIWYVAGPSCQLESHSILPIFLLCITTPSQKHICSSSSKFVSMGGNVSQKRLLLNGIASGCKHLVSLAGRTFEVIAICCPTCTTFFQSKCPRRPDTIREHFASRDSC